MRLTVLGCCGGIGGVRRTTALLLDDDILIDAGSGAGISRWSALVQCLPIYFGIYVFSLITGIFLLSNRLRWHSANR